MTKKQKSDIKNYIEALKSETAEGPGRMTSLTWEMLALIKVLLYEGQFQKYVFQSMGIPKTTWDSWAKKGRALKKDIQNKKKTFGKLKEADKKYLCVAGLIDAGKAKAIIKHQRIITDAAKDDWKASKWFLEMQDRELYGQKINANITADINMKSIADKYRERMNNGK